MNIVDPTKPAAPRLFGGKFQADRLIKRGLGVETWIGRDTGGEEPVVIKTLASKEVPASVRHRLTHEAEILQSLSGPYFPPLLAFDHEDDLFYLVMAYVRGTSLADRLGRGALTVMDTLSVAVCIAEALKSAHGNGVVHGDIKPANLIVVPENSTAPIERAVLVDFGFARSAELETNLRAQAVGTVRYMSPEQAGLLGRDVDHRADLYCLGVVLFECLAGRPPFLGNTISELLRQHLSELAPSLRSLNAAVPRALDAVVRRLLRKDPRDRYQSAEGVLHDCRAILAALEQGETDPDFVVGRNDRRQTLTEPAFVGRTMELGELRLCVERVFDGAGGITILEGESGAGKSRVLEELGFHFVERGASIFSGKGTTDTAQRPFQLLVGVAEDVLALASRSPEYASGLRERLGPHRDAVCAALPELARVLRPESSDAGPETFGETRTIHALGCLLDAIGTETHPAVIMLDDCQWMSVGTVLLLKQWAQIRAARLEPTYASVILSFRTEEVPSDHAIRHLPDAVSVKLTALSMDETGELMTSMAGQLPTEAVETVHRLSDGSPFMAAALLRGLAESGALVYESNTWRIQGDALADVRSSGQAAAILARRFTLLPDSVMRLLTVGAILGREFDVDLATTLAAVSDDEARLGIDEARVRHMVWTLGQGAKAVFVHDKLRETLLARLSESERARLHLNTALLIEAEYPDQVFEIAYHFDAGGYASRALPYALRGGDEARARYALELADELYRIAERGVPSTDTATCLRIAEARGDISMLRGRYEEAVACFRAANDLAQTDVDRGRISGKSGELAFKRGDMATATAAIERGLTYLGAQPPRSALSYLVACIWEISVQAFHSLLPKLFLHRRPMASAESDLRAVRLYSRLAYAYWFSRGQIPCLWAHLRGMNLAERYPATRELAQAYSEHAPLMSTLPWVNRGVEYATRSFAIRRDLGDLWGQGQALNFHGVVLYAAARFQECIEKCGSAVRLLERTGDLWEMNTAKWHIAYSHYRLGNMSEAKDIAQGVRQAGFEIGDVQASAIGLAAWTKASSTPTAKAAVEEALRRSTPQDGHSWAELRQAEAISALRRGDPEAAVAALTDAQKVIDERGLRQAYVSPVLPWLVTALRHRAEATSHLDPSRRREAIARAWDTLVRAEGLARSFVNDLPHVLREKGLLLALRGDPDGALTYLNESIATAERYGMRFELGESLITRGRVGEVHGWPSSASDIKGGTDLLSELMASDDPADGISDPPPAPLPAAVTMSLIDRFENLLEAGRRIGRAPTQDAVFESILEASRTLLRAERSSVVPVRVTSEGKLAFEPAFSGRFSETTARESINRRRPVVMVELPEDASESMVLEGSRSVLCAPIYRRGRAAAVLYVTHTQVGYLFGEVEERLAEFIVSIGSVALENAEGMAQAQAVSEERARLYEQSQRAVQSRDEFLSIASHELKTPLTPLRLQLQHLQRIVAQQPTPNPRVTDKLDVAVRQVQRFSVLVESLLDVSRIRAGRFKLQPESFDLRAVILGVIDQYTIEAKHTGCQVTFEDGAPIHGRWDKLRIEQVVANLLSNAIKYGRGNPVYVTVSERDDSVTLRVTDQGIGIPDNELSRLFDRFERGRFASRYGGMGLGLYIVRQIVDAHRGTVTVESTHGVGSTFIVVLPLETPSGSTIQAQESH